MLRLVAWLRFGDEVLITGGGGGGGGIVCRKFRG